jgi:SpoVK/Ycf46/Vps4 family AAA+-type ATPase
VPGCGKSATAKAIPAAWGDFPLLRLDLGALKGSLVGQSEENIRRALKLADAMGRVVLWIDEVGKALAGAQGPAGDSGVAADALGELLFWMQEHQGESLVVATTNETDLPPEFIRRFDATFFVDLPTAIERAAILAVALRQVDRQPDELIVDELVQATAGFSGDEVVKCVQGGLMRAWADEQRELQAGDLLAAARGTVPMSRSSMERIDAMRKWARGRALPASEPESEADIEVAVMPANASRFTPGAELGA